MCFCRLTCLPFLRLLSSAWLAHFLDLPECESAVGPVVKWEIVQERTRGDGQGCAREPESMSRVKSGPWGVSWACGGSSAACATEGMADLAD